MVFISKIQAQPGEIDFFEITAPSGKYSGFGKSYWAEILEANGLASFCFAKGWPDAGATLKAGESLKLLEISKAKPKGCYLKALKVFQRKDISLKVGYHSMYNESFTVERNFNMDFKELEIVSLIMERQID